MHNADLQEQLHLLEKTAAELRKDVAESADLEPLPLAGALVKAAALQAAVAKLAGAVRPQLSPLFKPNADGPDGDKKPRPKK